jgi:hypothetical protein
LFITKPTKLEVKVGKPRQPAGFPAASGCEPPCNEKGFVGFEGFVMK